MNFLLVALGLALVVGGAEILVRGASRLALSLGVSPLLIGLTVVAFGTSAPELAVAIQSVGKGYTEMAMGTIVGSNLFNTLIILGVSAAIAPLLVERSLYRLELPVLAAITIAAYLFLREDNRLDKTEGYILLLSFFLLSIAQYAQARRARNQTKESSDAAQRKDILWPLAFISAGLTLLVFGSRWLVEGAAEIARDFGMSEALISVTLLATGTSLPELVTSIVAALRRQADIAIGNVIGSNIFNLSLIGGFAAVIAPNGLPISNSFLHFDLTICLIVTICSIPLLLLARVFEREVSATFLLTYLVYVFLLLSR